MKQKQDGGKVITDKGKVGATGYSTVERAKRQWWAVADGDVREVTGYSCAPNNPNMWWCPEVGFSGAEGHHIFETRDEAFAKAIAELERYLTALQKSLECLKRRRQNVPAQPRREGGAA